MLGTVLDVNPAQVGTDVGELRDLGHPVMICTGPSPGTECPLLENGSCALVDAADGVIFRLDLDIPYHREMLRCYRDLFGSRGPLHVVVTEGDDDRYAALLDGMPYSVGCLDRSRRLGR